MEKSVYEDKLVKDFMESKDMRTDHEINGFRLRAMDSFPPNSNPYLHDSYNMGTGIGDNVEVMFGTRGNICEYLIIVDKVSGRRIKVMI
jgi:hypothetical protein